MLFDWVSDLHISHWKGEWGTDADGNQRKMCKKKNETWLDWSELKNPGSELLIIGGDTANHCSSTIELIRQAAKHYDKIFAIDGNHEYYEGFKRNYKIIYSLLEIEFVDEADIKFGKVSEVIGNTAFVGCMGWYDWQMMCPEYTRQQQFEAWNNDRYIRYEVLPPKLAERDKAWLQAEIVKFKADPAIAKIVVFTHTVPVRKGLMHGYGPQFDIQSGSYGNSLMREIVKMPDSKINYWLFGHSHVKNDFVEYGIRFIQAPRGYRIDDLNWQRPIQIDTEAPIIGSAFGEIEIDPIT
jgi:hypothetical protein